MDRRENILCGLGLAQMSGAEIGPLDRPLVQRSDGKVIYVDHCDTVELRKRWASDPNVAEDRIEVDAVWRSIPLCQTIAAIAGTDARLDYVIASHVIEHVPDLIRWLQEIADVLKDRGSLRLAVPDKRFTFDYLRNTTTLAEVLDAYVCERIVPAPSRILDFALNSVEVDCQLAWTHQLNIGALKHMYTHAQAIKLARDARQHGAYHDVHCWVFTQTSFSSLMLELAKDGMIEFACERLLQPEPGTFEFIVHLTRMSDQSERVRSWQAAVDGQTGHPLSADAS